MTIQNLRAISRQLYAEPVKAPTFADCKPMVAPSDHVGQYSQITVNPLLAKFRQVTARCAKQYGVITEQR